MSDYWWEPPFAGTEIEHLLGALDRQRATFRWKADGLDTAGLTATVGASSLTLGGLLKHLALVEDYHAAWKLHGESPGERWKPAQETEDWDYTSAADDAPEELYALWDSAVSRARERYNLALTDGGLDHPAHITGPDDQPVSLRRLLFDLLEEYARHTGHADLIRESVDGRTGEDPPAGWHPTR
ncbi:mycothiol transferase [Actinoplanes awajinensis]|uniref:Mini-circle protein n=1 Tax=Actinoplanes awajinensis subsp. mycoplanecinus TaxID=135947 RepID=A0A0X3URY7_9ACTN|nr:DUF664 domain-containing protein [Actinoplanes awajinensis]KUL35274.1 mini-circle protein [Actinoplanes awajinensis subsp. mycoplanecinus]